MKMMKRKIQQCDFQVLQIEEHFRSYFAMNEYQLRNMKGNAKEIFSAQLALILQSQKFRCTQSYNSTFRLLEKAILFEKPQLPEPHPKQNNQPSEKETNNEYSDN